MVRLVSNSQTQVIRLPWPPKVLGYRCEPPCPAPPWSFYPAVLGSPTPKMCCPYLWVRFSLAWKKQYWCFLLSCLLALLVSQLAVCQHGAGPGAHHGVVRGWELQLKQWVPKAEREQSATEFHPFSEAPLASLSVCSFAPSFVCSIGY